MLLDRPKETIVRELKALAESAWGAERAEALRAQIDETAGWMARIGRYPVAMDGDEPDYLAPMKTQEEDR